MFRSYISKPILLVCLLILSVTLLFDFAYIRLSTKTPKTQLNVFSSFYIHNVLHEFTPNYWKYKWDLFFRERFHDNVDFSYTFEEEYLSKVLYWVTKTIVIFCVKLMAEWLTHSSYCSAASGAWSSVSWVTQPGTTGTGVCWHGMRTSTGAPPRSSVVRWYTAWLLTLTLLCLHTLTTHHWIPSMHSIT